MGIISDKAKEKDQNKKSHGKGCKWISDSEGVGFLDLQEGDLFAIFPVNSWSI
jgi:hypothetical protein